jgi:FkbM family methyltransferase
MTAKNFYEKGKRFLSRHGIIKGSKMFCKIFLQRWLPWFPFLMRLPEGPIWLCWHDVCGNGIFAGTFEIGERKWVKRLLKPGMVFFDIGAHHGLYSLIASRIVGRSGVVVAFEPSPRERKKMKLNLFLNSGLNIRVFPLALGEKSGESDFFLVEGDNSGCNSLKIPNVPQKTRKIRVNVVTLDDFIETANLERLDLIKLDVEGAELSVLKGGVKSIQRFRPCFLCEVQDIRTQPWGYAAKEIVNFLMNLSYTWFFINPDGSLVLIDSSQEKFDANLVAIPNENLQELSPLFGSS